MRRVDLEIVVPLGRSGWSIDDLYLSLQSIQTQLHGARVSVIDGTDGLAEDVVRELIPEQYLAYDLVVGQPTRTACMYQALAGAKSTWVAYIEPGTIWRSDHLYRVGTMARRSALDVAFSGAHVKFDEWAEIPVVLASRNVIPTHAAVHKLSTYQDLIVGWPRDSMFGDWDLWAQFAHADARFGHDPQDTTRRTRPAPAMALKVSATTSPQTPFSAEDLEELKLWDEYIDSQPVPKVDG